MVARGINFDVEYFFVLLGGSNRCIAYMHACGVPHGRQDLRVRFSPLSACVWHIILWRRYPDGMLHKYYCCVRGRKITANGVYSIRYSLDEA